MKINAGRVLLALMLLTLSLAACGGDQPPPTIAPTAERSTESENEPIDTETESEPAIPAEDPTAEAPAAAEPESSGWCGVSAPARRAPFGVAAGALMLAFALRHRRRG